MVREGLVSAVLEYLTSFHVTVKKKKKGEKNLEEVHYLGLCSLTTFIHRLC